MAPAPLIGALHEFVGDFAGRQISHNHAVGVAALGGSCAGQRTALAGENERYLVGDIRGYDLIGSAKERPTVYYPFVLVVLDCLIQKDYQSKRYEIRSVLLYNEKT